MWRCSDAQVTGAGTCSHMLAAAMVFGEGRPRRRSSGALCARHSLVSRCLLLATASGCGEQQHWQRQRQRQPWAAAWALTLALRRRLSGTQVDHAGAASLGEALKANAALMTLTYVLAPRAGVVRVAMVVRGPMGRTRSRPVGSGRRGRLWQQGRRCQRGRRAVAVRASRRGQRVIRQRQQAQRVAHSSFVLTGVAVVFLLCAADFRTMTSATPACQH